MAAAVVVTTNVSRAAKKESKDRMVAPLGVGVVGTVTVKSSTS